MGWGGRERGKREGGRYQESFSDMPFKASTDGGPGYADLKVLFEALEFPEE